MATLNQFQQYSQGENTVTNNVLLMLSNLYEINPGYYEQFIIGITEDSGKYSVIPDFRQQIGNRGNGIIDGHIKVQASSIIIETKLHGLEWVKKLLKYTNSFDKNELKFLFHLSSDQYSESKTIEIQNKLKEKKLENIFFYSLTYQQFIDQLKELVSNYPYDPNLNKLSHHFENYCHKMNLTPRSQHILRAMACGQSFELNKKHRFYFDLAKRGYSDFNYLGIYKSKAVQYIGRVENIIEADWNKNEGLIIKNSNKEVTEEQKRRLVNAIKDALTEDWTVDKDHRFFLLKDFKETYFAKTSPGGIFRVRYFNLEKVLNKQIPSQMENIAKELRNHTWE